HYAKGNTKLRKNTKHVINFFGIFGCIKFNALGKDALEKPESKLVKYYFDYPYFSRIVNPEFFQEELNNEERQFTRKIVSLWLCFAISSAVSAALLYLAYKNQKSKKVLVGLVFASVVLLILATVCFVVVCLWVFFDFIKKKFVVHRIKSFLENEVSPEWIKLYKKELVGDTQEVDAETYDQESAKNKDIEDIVEFLLERKKIVALYNFLTNGEELVQAGMAMVNMLLVKGIHPNNIVLDTNSLGGGIAAEVLKRFEDQGIHLTLIHSNSYSSLKDATNNFPHGIGNFFTRRLPAKFLNFWFKRSKLEFNSQEIIENTKCPVLIAGRKGDTVIPQAAQLAGKLSDRFTKTGQLRKNIVLEHDPTIPCGNKNIHTDHKEHLIHRQDNGDAKRYKEVEDKFIDEAHKHLIINGLNGEFDLNKYIVSGLSGSLTKIELKSIGEKYI
ncbi:hypothetical protein, partial [Wolbachia endosymbiont of Atemnus politus]